MRQNRPSTTAGASGKTGGMNRHPARIVLRELAVLVTALALVVAGNLATRAHLSAHSGPPTVLCHGAPEAGAASNGWPDAQHDGHLCNLCACCQATLAATALPDLAPRPLRHEARVAAATPRAAMAARRDLPPATGPPHFG